LREIKFRQWSSDRFHYWGCNADNFTGPLSNRLDIPSEQFTGLHDKNGKEIYEGDIIRSKNHHPEKMEIRFIEGGFCAWWGSDDYPIDIYHFYNSKGCCFEVIGNIHENPELLEVTK
jgi:uncharacterized phage protein (TIGR01671 family)